MGPTYPSNRFCIYRGIYMYHLIYTDNDRDIQVHSITRRFLTEVQTDAQNVPVDDEILICKLAVMLM